MQKGTKDMVSACKMIGNNSLKKQHFVLRDKITEIFVNIVDSCKDTGSELKKTVYRGPLFRKTNRKVGSCNREM